MAKNVLRPCRGKLSIDGEMASDNYDFADIPEIGDWQWEDTKRGTIEILRIDSVSSYDEFGEKRYHVHAKRTS